MGYNGKQWDIMGFGRLIKRFHGKTPSLGVPQFLPASPFQSPNELDRKNMAGLCS